MMSTALPTEMYVNYIQRRKLDHAALTEALESSDYDVFKRIGHQIKGNAASFGFDDLAVLAERLEKVSLKDEQSSVRSMLDQMQKWILEKEADYR